MIENKLLAMLFDLDGTLLNTAPEFSHCLNQLLIANQQPALSDDIVRQAVSNGSAGLIKLGFNIDQNHPNFSKLQMDLLNFYQKDLGNNSLPFPGIYELIENLHKNNIKWGIVTNKPKQFTNPLIEKINFPIKPSCVVSGDSVDKAKPSSLSLKYACKLINISPNNCIYVGDDHNDVIASKKAAMPCIFAKYGYIPKDENPLSFKAAHYVNCASEIFPWIQKNYLQ